MNESTTHIELLILYAIKLTNVWSFFGILEQNEELLENYRSFSTARLATRNNSTL